MRKAVFLALALAVLTATASLASAAALVGNPQLRVVATAPVKVQGINFKSRERVTLTVRANGVTRVRNLRANVHGRFAATFDGIEVTDRCSSDLWARATGRRGSIAIAKLPMLQCPPPLRGPSPP